jgi:chromosome segregation ATPase
MERFHIQNIEQLNQDRATKKEERQRALAHGENVSKLTNALSRIDSKMEESEDALIGIKQRSEELKPEIYKLEQEIVWMELEVEREKLWKVARKYNEKAKELAEIARDFWDLYDHVDNYRYEKNGYRWNFSSGIHCDDFYHGSLNKIVFLRINGEPPRKSSWTDEYLFDLYSYRNYERSSE